MALLSSKTLEPSTAVYIGKEEHKISSTFTKAPPNFITKVTEFIIDYQ